MSSSVTCALPLSRTEEDYLQSPTEIVVINESIYNQIAKRRAYPAPFHSAFLGTSTLLAIFFLVSLILAFTSKHILDWPTSLVGLLGTAGLALVGLFSLRQIQSE